MHGFIPARNIQGFAYYLRNLMYKLIRKILFLFDAEKVHYFAMNFLKFITRIPFAGEVIKNLYTPENISTGFLGLKFRNPVGLAAGFDKNAKYLETLWLLGFGFVEIGTVTPLPQAGNEKPRLFRLPKDKAIINRMGFNNDGMEVIAERLKKFRQTNHELIIGGNIGKNKITPNEDAWLDYEKCFSRLFNVVDYFVVNVSSPNTPGLRDLQQKEALKKILTHLQNLNSKKERQKPVLLKIAPDLNMRDLDEIIDLCMEIKLDGLVATNTTISRDHCITDKHYIEKLGAGGLSGKPLFDRSNEILAHISHRTNGMMKLIGSGGIMNGHDAQQKVDAGASLIQVYTGFIYTGPLIVRKIVEGFKRNFHSENFKAT